MKSYFYVMLPDANSLFCYILIIFFICLITQCKNDTECVQVILYILYYFYSENLMQNPWSRHVPWEHDSSLMRQATWLILLVTWQVLGQLQSHTSDRVT